MNFYRRRPLALIISLCLITSVLSALIPGNAKVILIAVCGIISLFVILLTDHQRKKLFCNIPQVLFFVIASAMIMCTLLISYVYYDVYAAKYSSLDTGHIRAVVTEVESCTAYNTVYVVRLESCGGEPSRAKGLLYTETALALALGDIIEAEVDFCELDEFHESYDTPRTALLADGYVFTCQTAGAVEVVGSKDLPDIWFTRLRDDFSARMSLYLDRNAVALSDALLLGERGGLGRVHRAFTYIGITHILALSGLHIAILSGGLTRLLERLGFGKKPQTAAVFIFLLFYVSLTGFLMSAVRAAIMLMLTFAASVISSGSDRVTALFAACGLIVFTCPAAVFDVSLQLSFFATLGVLLMSESSAKLFDDVQEKSWRHILLRYPSKLIRGIFVSLGATMFILPLQWLYFGELSLLSIPATIIISIICEALLLVLPVHLIFSLTGFHFISRRLGFIVTALARLCSDTAEYLASFPSLISLHYPFAFPIIILTVCVIVWMMAKNFSSWLWALIPFGAASAVFLFGVTAYNAAYYERATIDYMSDSSGDIVAAVSERQAIIIDVTDGSRGLMYDARQHLSESFVTEIDTLLLTHLHRRHTSSVRALLKNRIVHRIIIPLPSGEYDKYIADELCDIAAEYGAEAILYSSIEDAEIIFNDLKLTLPTMLMTERAEEPLRVLQISCQGTDISYIGACAWESEYLWNIADDAKYLIFGSHGPSIKEAPNLVLSDKTEFILISSEEVGTQLSGCLSAFDGTAVVDSELLVVIDP